MATSQLLYANQFIVTTLNVGGGITDSDTTGIIISDVTGIDTTKPGIALINYSDPLNTTLCEWVEYTSINGSKELVGVTRGSEGFSAKAHDNGVQVAFPFSESHINRLNAMFDTVGLDVAQIATPASPSSGRDKLYFKSDDLLYSLTSGGVETAVGSGGGGTSFWTGTPGTPVRVSDTQFTITDTSNTNKYDLLLKKGVILKWDESGTFQTAVVSSSSYSSNTVTVNIIGDSLTAGFSSMKYAISMCEIETFIYAGTLPSAAATNISKTWHIPCDGYVLGALPYHGTAGTTNATTYDFNDDGTTKFTTKLSVASAATKGTFQVADTPSTAVAEDSVMTLDMDSVSTTAPVDTYVYVYWYPVSWRYRT